MDNYPYGTYGGDPRAPWNQPVCDECIRSPSYEVLQERIVELQDEIESLREELIDTYDILDMYREVVNDIPMHVWQHKKWRRNE